MSLSSSFFAGSVDNVVKSFRTLCCRDLQVRERKKAKQDDDDLGHYSSHRLIWETFHRFSHKFHIWFWMCIIAAHWLWKCISVDDPSKTKDDEKSHKREKHCHRSGRCVRSMITEWLWLCLPMIVLDIKAKNAQSKANNNVLNGNSKNYSRVSRNL